MPKPFFLWRHLNKLRWATLSLVFAMLIILPLLSVYQTYVAAHAYDLLSPSQQVLYDTAEWFSSPFTDDPANDLDAVKGTLWSGTLFGLQLSDPLAVVNHPWQPAVQHLHVWAAPLLVFAAGVIWRAHVWEHWTRGVRARRRSGVGLVVTLVPMVVSGYLIQTAISDRWRTAWVAVHVTASVLWLAGYLAHQLASRPAARSRKVELEAELPHRTGQTI